VSYSNPPPPPPPPPRKCKTWPVKTRAVQGLRAFQKKEKNMFGSKVKKIRSGWRKLHGDELLKSYSSPILIRLIK
jgi:hypothetical protein